MRLALDRLPIDQECDRVFRLWDTIIRFARCDSGRSTRDNTGGYCNILQDPAANIDMMRR